MLKNATDVYFNYTG
jgi:lysosomal Pro-X carboxypeptidase